MCNLVKLLTRYAVRQLTIQTTVTWFTTKATKMAIGGRSGDRKLVTYDTDDGTSRAVPLLLLPLDPPGYEPGLHNVTLSHWCYRVRTTGLTTLSTLTTGFPSSRCPHSSFHSTNLTPPLTTVLFITHKSLDAPLSSAHIPLVL